VTDAATNQTQYAYDTESNLTGITDAKNRVTSFAYDIKDRLTQTTFPSTLSETYTYDAIDNLASKTDRKSQTINYVYDATIAHDTMIRVSVALRTKTRSVSRPGQIVTTMYQIRQSI
jgi:YD repeat-containing protein